MALLGRSPLRMESVSISKRASYSPYSAWKCGGLWSLKYIRITIPKNRVTSGISSFDSTPPHPLRAKPLGPRQSLRHQDNLEPGLPARLTRTAFARMYPGRFQASQMETFGPRGATFRKGGLALPIAFAVLSGQGSRLLRDNFRIPDPGVIAGGSPTVTYLASPPRIRIVSRESRRRRSGCTLRAPS
jgi:hypothetical protein